MKEFSKHLVDQDATVKMGKDLASLLTQAAVIFLHGDLGAGKTTFSRGVIQGLGHNGNVKSPTYTLVEPYELDAGLIYHFDLYRLGDPEELEYLGIRDYFSLPAVRLIEWPQRGAGVLPQPDLSVFIDLIDAGRTLRLEPHSEIGERIIKALAPEAVT